MNSQIWNLQGEQKVRERERWREYDFQLCREEKKHIYVSNPHHKLLNILRII